MKKIFLLVVISLAVAAKSFALNPTEYNALYKLNNKTALTSLVGYIDANEEQANYLKHVFQATENALKNAEAKGNEAAINSAVNYNLLNTKAILSEEQYKRYLSFVNYYLRDENNFASLSSLK